MKEKFIALLTFTSSLKNFGIKFIRVAILVVFVWIGGLKYFHYEADGIVPFVANSPFMSFFYAKDAPEYKDHKNPEGAFVPENRAWHEANRTYTFSYGLGALIMSIGILVFLGIFFPKVALVGDTLAIIMTLGTLSFLVTTPEVWVPNLGGDEFGFIFKGQMEKEDIFLLMEDMRKNYDVKLPDGMAMTISIGIATAFENASRYQELVRMADSAMFRAKYNGRNKVALAKEEKMVPKTSHYTQDQLKRLNLLSKREGIGEAILLREAMDMLLKKYDV